MSLVRKTFRHQEHQYLPSSAILELEPELDRELALERELELELALELERELERERELALERELAGLEPVGPPPLAEC